MAPTKRSRWIVGETLDTLNDETRVCMVRTEYPRLIGVFCSSGDLMNGPTFNVFWSEAELSNAERIQFSEDAKRFFLEYNIAAYGRTGPSWSR